MEKRQGDREEGVRGFGKRMEWKGKKGGECLACDKGVVETLEHVLVECEAYERVREEWWRVVREVGGVGGVQFNPVKAMLGRVSGMSDDGRLRVAVASTRLFVKLWSERTNRLYGQWGEPLGVKDVNVMTPQ